MNYSIRLQMTRESEFYICILLVKEFSQTQSDRVCAIDPGVRDFITHYDPGGLTIGVTDGKDKTFQRCLSIDRLQSKLSREHLKRYRYRLKKLIYRMYQRIEYMVKDMHQKCSKWLSVNYDEVLLPKFATSEMTQKQKRISSKTSRAMLTWSHYKFKVMLADKMKRTGGRMIECTEPFTSKTSRSVGESTTTSLGRRRLRVRIAITFSTET